MDLKPWLLKTGVGQRELSRRLGYTGNGFVTLVANKGRKIPGDEILNWADALGLQGEDRRSFISEASEGVIPSWLLQDLAALEVDLAKTRQQADQQSALIRQLATELLRLVPQLDDPTRDLCQSLIRSVTPNPPPGAS